ncbi:MAG: NADAR family protein [Methylococcales bacterium]|nr:MAG: NADAR family protein [Methylococcales bacterium]
MTHSNIGRHSFMTLILFERLFLSQASTIITHFAGLVGRLYFLVIGCYMNFEIVQVESSYCLNEVSVFCKVKEKFGGLSNMSNAFPVSVNGYDIANTEALYQACRFPDHPEIQNEIILLKSPMRAKMKSRSKRYRLHTRADWDAHRIEIMWWCLRVKLAQNGHRLGEILESTGNMPIVERSPKDRFWGAVLNKEDESMLSGMNILGQLLMQLRAEYISKKENIDELSYVQPLEIENFLLISSPILAIGTEL